jgi:type II secretory pathway component HofQ
MRVPALLPVVALLLLSFSPARAQERSRGAEPSTRPDRASRPAFSRNPPRTIDLDLVRADLRNVLRLFAEVSGMNFVYGEEVGGEMAREGDIVRIASRETLAREREARLNARRSCLESSRPRTRLIRLNYGRAEAMAELVRASLGERGRVWVDERTNTLVVSNVDCP